MGREIARQDGPSAPKVAVVNEPFARKYFAGENPVGRRFHLMRAAKDDPGFEVIGVVRDSKHADLREDPQPFVYYPYQQHESIMRMNFYVRTSQDPMRASHSSMRSCSSSRPCGPRMCIPGRAAVSQRTSWMSTSSSVPSNQALIESTMTPTSSRSV
jgi:hypothetical protein